MSVHTCVQKDLRSADVEGLSTDSATGGKPSWGKRIGRSLGALVVFGALIALAVAGHRNDWKLPKFAALLGRDSAEKDDWCSEHSVPESRCIECDQKDFPRDKDYGWCQEHGVAQCPLHHPDVAQLRATPAVAAADFERAERALTLVPRPDNNSRCKLHEKRIQFASIESFDKAGVDIAVADVQPVAEVIVANGEVLYDPTRLARLASRVSGSVYKVERRVGEQVRKGGELALVDSAEVGRAKSELLQAISQLRLKQTNRDRLRPIADDGAVPVRQLREAEAALQDAKIRLLAAEQSLANLGLNIDVESLAKTSLEDIARQIQFLGISTAAVGSESGQTTTSNLFPLKSPLDGVVVDCKIVAGEVVDASTTVFTVADIDHMFVVLNVRQEDAKYVKLGQPVLFRSGEEKDALESRGTVDWISTAADEQTRSVKVRVDLPNRDRRLRANVFGTGRIVLRSEPSAVVVPNEAVHWDGCCNVVFVRDKNFLAEGSPKFFHVRKVRTGFKDDNGTEIIVGLLPGEVVAAKNSVVLEAQLLKSNLGAGCGCCSKD